MTAEQSKLSLTPVNLNDAKQFVTEVHRHHGPTAGHRFSSGAQDESGTLRAVMTMGRAVAPKTDQMAVLEVTRVASDGCPNACSFLYGAACRIHRVHGFGYAQTFTLITEPGTSLIAAGWKAVGVTEPRTHKSGWGSRPGRTRNPHATNVPKIKWECRCGPDPQIPLAELRAQLSESALEMEASGLAPPPPAVLDDDFVVRLLRSFLRAGHCSGFPLSHGTRKKYVDVVRCLEKREARRLRNA